MVYQHFHERFRRHKPRRFNEFAEYNLMGKLYFIDEGNRFVSSQRFAEMVRISGNYFVIVTRENLYSLP